MNSDLFPTLTVLSPRLKWMQEHEITIGHHEGIFIARLGKASGMGGSEELALDDLCQKAGLKHWKE